MGWMAIIVRFECKRQKFSGVSSQLVCGHAPLHQIRYPSSIRFPTFAISFSAMSFSGGEHQAKRVRVQDRAIGTIR
jgi:hypothetical protein